MLFTINTTALVMWPIRHIFNEANVYNQKEQIENHFNLKFGVS